MNLRILTTALLARIVGIRVGNAGDEIESVAITSDRPFQNFDSRHRFVALWIALKEYPENA